MILRPAAPAPVRVRHRSGGFTLIELMIGLVIFSLLAGTVITILVGSSMQKAATTNEVDSTQMGRLALQMLSRDLRSAGFGTDISATPPQPAIAYIDSMQVLINANLTPVPDTSQVARGIPLAYYPAGSPRPKPLNGTSWTPPMRYRTGAETIRWTLDLNNDGAVDAMDLSDGDAADARRTPNPNDYELVREVYGDSTNGSHGNNGGKRDRVAIIKRPGNGTPALFTVYLTGDAGPWDWSKGPVPANRLGEIERVEVTVVATSPTKNFMQNYSDVRLTTSVSELRNSPNFQWIRYAVSGYVFNDANKDTIQDNGEVGVAGVNLTLGGYLTATTGATGFFSFNAPPGTYVLKQSVPQNYGVLTNPDSFIVTIGPDVQKNFADTLRAGGWATVTVYNDVDASKSYNGGDVPMQDLPVTLLGSTPKTFNTDNNGQVVMFLPVGTSQVSASLPDSFVFSTSNPVSITMTQGGTKTASIGMKLLDYGTVTGYVFNDDNGNAVFDSKEKGVGDAYVGCVLPDSTVVYTYTDHHGYYALKLPVNDPPKTTSYTVTTTPPPGYSSSAAPITSLWLKSKQILTNQNFALAKFAVWQHDVDRYLSAIATTDFIEHDWPNGQPKHAVHDLDLVIGTANTDQSEIQQWFNNYDDNPPFHAMKKDGRDVSQSVLTIACDTLDAASADGFCRPDVIAGTRYEASGNWGIWFTQNGTGNEGYLGLTEAQKYTTADKGDVQKILTYSGGAGNAPVIVVGTRSPAFGTGTIEIWTSASHSTPAYTQTQIIPPTGLVPGNNLGEVATMQLGDLNNDGVPELVVGTLTGFYSGQIMVFKLVAGVWTYQWKASLATDAVTALTLADINADGKEDIVVGTQSGLTSGNLIYYKNKTGGGAFTFDVPITVAAQGVVSCLDHVDYAGDGSDDLIVGWRDSELTFNGGLEIWYNTAKAMPTSGVDATDGKVKRWVECMVVGDFNYGLWPKTPKETIPDIMVIVRRDKNHGTLFELIR